MATKATSAKLTKKHLTKEEKEKRLAIENQFSCERERPPKYLTREQKRIYKWIYDHLMKAEIASKLDMVSIANAAVIIDILNGYNEELNTYPEKRYDTRFMNLHSKLLTSYFKVCNELCLSPSARAKVGTMALKASQEEVDPLLQAIKGYTDE